MFQFAIAMTGTIILAVYAVNSPEIGGIAGLKAALPAETLSFCTYHRSGGRRYRCSWVERGVLHGLHRGSVVVELVSRRRTRRRAVMWPSG